MQIKRDRKYTSNLFTILRHIAQDKISVSRNFKNELDKKINNLTNFPYKNRPSIYFDNEDIRDMIFKGYTITYEINIQDGTLAILDIFNQNKQ